MCCFWRKIKNNSILFLDWTEYVFLCLFIFEMFLRMWALGPRIYFQASFNRFDCIMLLQEPPFGTVYLNAMLVALVWLWGCGRSQCSELGELEHTRRRFARFAYICSTRTGAPHSTRYTLKSPSACPPPPAQRL